MAKATFYRNSRIFMELKNTATLKESLETIQQKARERTVKTQNVEYDLETLIKRIKQKTIKLDPDYQRRHRWSNETSSRLIESLILNIPIPVIFISQDVDVDDEVDETASRYTVIDGQQRLTAIFDFITNSMELEGLETLTELNGSYYKDLPPFLTRRLEERTIKCLRIDSTVDDQVKFDIFERLNTGSIRLESQELRNVTARGPFNNKIKELAKGKDFRALIQVDGANPDENAKVKKMEDAELVLRYFALRYRGPEKIGKGFKEFLTGSLTEFNRWSKAEIEEKSEEFNVYMSFILRTMGTQAFAKWRIEPNAPAKKMSSFNAAVFDAVSIGLARTIDVKDLAAAEAEITPKLLRVKEVMFGNKDFFDAISGSVNDVGKVSTRIRLVQEHLA
jgi:hypothetical protein